MSNYAKFKATLAKVTVNGKKAQVLLELPHKDLAKHYLTLVQSIDDEIEVAFGSPQMSIEDMGVRMPERTGIVGTVGPGGVVENIKKPKDEEGQLDLEDVEEGAEDEPDAPYDVGEEDLEDEGGSEFDEMNFDDPLDDEPDQPDPEQEEGDELSDKARLEAFILEQKPVFEDIPFNFPQLLERKRESKETWLEIASDLGERSTILQAAYSKYKARVKEQMVG